MESGVERLASFETKVVGKASPTPPCKTSSTPTYNKHIEETDVIEESTEDDTNKDYYAKFQEDSQFRHFVENLLRSSSTKNLKFCKKSKLDSVHGSNDNKNGNTETGSNMDISLTKSKGKTSCNLGNTNKTKLADKTPKTSNNKATPDKSSKTTPSPQYNDDISHTRRQYQDLARDRRPGARHGLGVRNETRKHPEVGGKDSRVKKDQGSEEFGFSFGVSKSCSYSTLPRERASVVLREKHLSPRQTREDCTKSGVFTMPRVSCYHRSTRR